MNSKRKVKTYSDTSSGWWAVLQRMNECVCWIVHLQSIQFPHNCLVAVTEDNTITYDRQTTELSKRIHSKWGRKAHKSISIDSENWIKWKINTICFHREIEEREIKREKNQSIKRFEIVSVIFCVCMFIIYEYLSEFKWLGYNVPKWNQPPLFFWEICILKWIKFFIEKN